MIRNVSDIDSAHRQRKFYGGAKQHHRIGLHSQWGRSREWHLFAYVQLSLRLRYNRLGRAPLLSNVQLTT